MKSIIRKNNESSNSNLDEMPFIPNLNNSIEQLSSSVLSHDSNQNQNQDQNNYDAALSQDNESIDSTNSNEYLDEFNSSRNSAKIYFGCFLIDPELVKSAWTDCVRVVLPSLVTKTVGRLLWLGHIISPNILSLAFLASNAAVGCLISLISATLEFGIRMFELYKNNSDKNLWEKIDSSLRISLKTAVKFFCVYMSWVLGTFAMTAAGIMSGPYLALGILGVGIATAIGLAFATVLTEVLPLLWKEEYQKFTISLINNCKINLKHKKKLDNFFKNHLENIPFLNDKSKENFLINKIQQNDEINFILTKQGYDLNNNLDKEEILSYLKSKDKLNFSPVKGAILRGGLEGVCWSSLENILNGKNLDRKIDAGIVSLVVSTSFLIGGCLDYIFRIKYFQTRNHKVLKKQIENIEGRILEKINQDIASDNLKPSDILNLYRLCNRIKNIEFKNKVIKWVKLVIAYNNFGINHGEDTNSNPQSPNGIEEMSHDQNISWQDLKVIIDQPRAIWSLGFFCCKTRTSMMLDKSLEKDKECIKSSCLNINQKIVSMLGLESNASQEEVRVLHPKANNIVSL